MTETALIGWMVAGLEFVALVLAVGAWAGQQGRADALTDHVRRTAMTLRNKGLPEFAASVEEPIK